jgi:hypothetical protein
MTQVIAKLVLDIKYDTTELGDEGVATVEAHLNALIEALSNNGDLSGYNDMTVDEWSVKVVAHENKTRITYDEFEAKYVPIKNHLDDNASFDGCMFETDGAELDYVLSLANDEYHTTRVWTVLDSMEIISGYHLCNHLGYIITGKFLEQEYMEVYDPDMDSTIRDLYEDMECPDCHEDIPFGVVDGEACTNCGHVFTAEYIVIEDD